MRCLIGSAFKHCCSMSLLQWGSHFVFLSWDVPLCLCFAVSREIIGMAHGAWALQGSVMSPVCLTAPMLNRQYDSLSLCLRPCAGAQQKVES